MSDQSNRDAYTPPDSNLVDGGVSTNNADKIFVGKNYEEYYRQKFEHFDSSGKKTSWNWVSFFFTWPWLLYRKMWLNCILYIFVVPIIMALIGGGMAMVLGTAGLALYYLMALIFAYVLMPMFSNWLYYAHARRKIAAVEATGVQGTERVAALTRKGGTSMVAMIIIGLFMFIMVLGILAAIAIPAYSSYVNKAKFTEVVQKTASVKLEIDMCYSQNQNLAECAGPYDLSQIVSSSEFVSALEVVPGTAEIVATSSDELGGYTFTLQPLVSGEGLEWQSGGSCINAGLC